MKNNHLKKAYLLLSFCFLLSSLSIAANPKHIFPVHPTAILKQSVRYFKTLDSSLLSIENCVGNACGNISITQGNHYGPDRLTIKNTGTQSVVVSIRFYYAGCQDAMTLTLSAYESQETMFIAYCPPYSANYK